MKVSGNGDITSGQNQSPWSDTVSPLFFDTLKENTQAATVIIGGGIAGLSVAYMLACENEDVVVVEDGAIGSGETGRTTAHLVTALDNRYYRFQLKYGEDLTRQIANSHARAIDEIEKIVRNENIDCDFRRTEGYLFLHPNDDPKALDAELEAARNAGLNVEKVVSMPGIGDNSPALRFPAQATFHPLKYLDGLCKAIQRKGGRIYTGTHVKDIDDTGITTSEGYRITAKHMVVATNSPVNIKYAIHLKQYPYRTYAIGALVAKGVVPPLLWWDTGDPEENSSIPPYHYVRTQPYDAQHDLLLCGGEDHPTGLPGSPEENRYERLESWARSRFPVQQIKYRWSGQVLEPMDGLAFIGRNPSAKSLYTITGDSGNGMTHGTIAGILVTDLIRGRENEWEKIYSPSRFHLLKTGGTFFRELASMLINYYKNKPRETSSVTLASIQPGSGAILEMDGHKYGAYVDESKMIHLVDAECTHLGCIIHWNNDEKTWDCPCHGSRFSYDGKVMNGPANMDLPYFEEGAKETIAVHQNNLSKKS